MPRPEKEILKREQLPPEPQDSGSEVKLSDEKKLALGGELQARFHSLKSLRERAQWEAEKAEAFRLYHMQPDHSKPLPFEGAANLPCVLPRIGVDAFHAQVMNAIFGNGERSTVSSKVANKNYASIAERGAHYLSYVLEHEVDFYSIFDDADKKANIYGVGYLEPRYVKEHVWETVKVTEEVVEPVLDPVTGQVSEKRRKKSSTKKIKKTIFDGTKIDSLDVEDVYASPFLQDLEECVKLDVVFKKFRESISSIDRKVKNKVYDTDGAERVKTLMQRELLKSMTDLEQERSLRDGFFEDLLMKESVELADAHLWKDVDGDDIEEKILVTFHPGTGAILRVVLAPCRIVDLNPRPVDGRREGEGIPKIGHPIWEEWEAVHNSRVNKGTWEHTPFGFYRAGGRFNPTEYTFVPGRFYPIDDPREVNMVQPPVVGQSFFNEEGLLLNYFERVFALSENIQGVRTQETTSATETINLSKNAAVRFNNPFLRIITQLDKLLQHIWDLNRECAPKTKEFYVSGPGEVSLFQTMGKTDFITDIKWKFDISTVFDEQLARDTAMLTYRMLLSNPLVMQHPSTIYDVTNELLKAVKSPISLPKPPQSKTLSPYEEHEMFLEGKTPEPEVGEDVDEHMRVHMDYLTTEEFKELEQTIKQAIVVHIDKTQILKQTLQSAQLNQSGIAENMGLPMGSQQPGQPGVTANRNPTQFFNSLRVGETGASQRQNLRNGEQGR